MSPAARAAPPDAGTRFPTDRPLPALSGTLNVDRTAREALELLGPLVADWAALVLPGSRPGELHVYGGADPAYRSTAEAADSEQATGIARLLKATPREVAFVASPVTDAGGPASGSAAVSDGMRSLIPSEALRAQAAHLEPATVLGVALTARGRRAGALVLVRRADSTFEDADLERADEVAARTAAALDSARMYEQRSAVVTALQSFLRPEPLPRPARLDFAAEYRPGRDDLDVGGDFYDVVRLGEDFFMTIGDVCGNGVEAALQTIRARDCVLAATSFTTDPGAVLAALNDVLYRGRMGASGRFVTAQCARLRLTAAGAHALVASAGHPEPMVLRAHGQVETVAVSGLVAGVAASPTYNSVAVDLAPDDVLVMVTDGTVESRDRTNTLYGEQRLQTLLARYAGATAQTVCDAIRQDVVDFAGGELGDDVAVLVARVEST